MKDEAAKVVRLLVTEIFDDKEPVPARRSTAEMSDRINCNAYFKTLRGSVMSNAGSRKAKRLIQGLILKRAKASSPTSSNSSK
jgi:uncharacterized membrane protein